MVPTHAQQTDEDEDEDDEDDGRLVAISQHSFSRSAKVSASFLLFWYG